MPTTTRSLTPEELLTQLKKLIRLHQEITALLPKVTSELIESLARLHKEA